MHPVSLEDVFWSQETMFRIPDSGAQCGASCVAFQRAFMTKTFVSLRLRAVAGNRSAISNQT